MAGQCDRCCGNGEIVTDWDEYLHPPEDADPDAGTVECPNCDGTGSNETESSYPGGTYERIRTHGMATRNLDGRA